MSTAARAPRGFPMDAYRRGDRFIVEFDLPGVEPASIELTVEQNVLSVRAERRFEPRECDEVIVAERPQGTYARQVFLGDALDSERVQANCRHGVLTLTIPVAEAAKPRRVPVGGGQDAQTIEPLSAGGAAGRAAGLDRRTRGAERRGLSRRSSFARRTGPAGGEKGVAGAVALEPRTPRFPGAALAWARCVAERPISGQPRAVGAAGRRAN